MCAEQACMYQYGTFECRGDGFLWDADTDGWDPEEQDHPCPRCNTKEYLERAKGEAESVSYGTTMTHAYTGESAWQGAVEVAMRENQTASQKALARIGQVDALRSSSESFTTEIVRYAYVENGAAVPPVVVRSVTGEGVF